MKQQQKSDTVDRLKMSCYQSRNSAGYWSFIWELFSQPFSVCFLLLLVVSLWSDKHTQTLDISLSLRAFNVKILNVFLQTQKICGQIQLPHTHFILLDFLQSSNGQKISSTKGVPVYGLKTLFLRKSFCLSFGGNASEVNNETSRKATWAILVIRSRGGERNFGNLHLVHWPATNIMNEFRTFWKTTKDRRTADGKIGWMRPEFKMLDSVCIHRHSGWSKNLLIGSEMLLSARSELKDLEKIWQKALYKRIIFMTVVSFGHDGWNLLLGYTK